ncbi:MAG: beta-ketoacyl-[acyl-carrier-protein] synthase family protein [Polyangiales bacterium]
MSERVVITGIGAISSVGNTARATFESLTQGRSGIRELPWPLPLGAEVRIGGMIEQLEPAVLDAFYTSEEVGRYAHLALFAAREAAADAGFDKGTAGYEPHRIATILGAGLSNGEALIAAAEKLAAGKVDEIPAGWGDRLAPHASTELVADVFGAQGPSCCLQSACASSAHAIGHGFDLVRNGVVDVAVVGGAEAPVAPFALSLFERIGALSKYTGPAHQASRPYERDRSGFVMGEGAGMLVLETLSSAKKRGAKIYAEVAGYGATADAFHVTRPHADGIGMARAIRRALKVGGVNPDEVDYVNAHGTGTEFNDEAETMALKEVFGDHAKKLWISSNKSMIGHLLGAAAAVETVAAVYTLASGMVPPTINLDNPDPDCDLDYVPLTAREKPVKVVIKNSFGFGGQNASLVLRAV